MSIRTHEAPQPPPPPQPPAMSALEAKIVVLGSQGVGKTSLVTRYCKGAFDPAQTVSTVGASFMTKRVVDGDTDTVVRLQIWDTAGQERFRSISRLYYRGANACILCYSITDAHSFAEMGVWLTELRRNLPPDIVLHVVGTKADIVAREPARREVPFERCIAYVAENLAPGLGSTPPPTATPTGGFSLPLGGWNHSNNSSNNNNNNNNNNNSNNNTNYNNYYNTATTPGTGSIATTGGGGTGQGGLAPSSAAPPQQQQQEPRSPSSKRSSGFWGQEVGWDACHEISAESGEGVEEVFRVVTRKLVEQNRRLRQDLLAASASLPSSAGFGFGFGAGATSSSSAGADSAEGYFDAGGARGSAGGSFRVGRDRRSWLFSPAFSPSVPVDNAAGAGAAGAGWAGQPGEADKRARRCC